MLALLLAGLLTRVSVVAATITGNSGKQIDPYMSAIKLTIRVLDI